MQVAVFFVQVFYAYLFCGLLFAVFFLGRGAAKIDENAAGISWTVRLFLFPGSVALWPVLLNKWRKSRTETSRKHPEAASPKS